MSASHPTRRISLVSYRNSRSIFTRDRNGYFLFFRFRIATTSDANVRMIINSSYVLISIILSTRLGTDRGPPVGCLGKHIILSMYCRLNVEPELKDLELHRCKNLARVPRSGRGIRLFGGILFVFLLVFWYLC